MPDNPTNARADARAFITRTKLASASRLKASGRVAVAAVGEGVGRVRVPDARHNGIKPLGEWRRDIPGRFFIISR